MSGPVLVTGGAGSLGRRVAGSLHAAGREVRILDLPSLDFTGLEGVDGIQILRGDLMEPGSITEATKGVGAIIHLAALLPPRAGEDRDNTFAVNVDATRRLAEELQRNHPGASFVFSSSVSTYGDTSRDDPPVRVEHAQEALGFYAESKIAAERALREVCPDAVILRISGIAVPAVYEPPEIWPFMSDQRIEFVHRDDVVAALCSAAQSEDARGKDLIVAGGPSWQIAGRAYVSNYYDLLGVDINEARFQDRPGSFDFYFTEDSQRTLGYQHISYQEYLDQIRQEMERLMAEPS